MGYWFFHHKSRIHDLCWKSTKECVQRQFSSPTSTSSVSASPSTSPESFNSWRSFSVSPSSPCSTLWVPPLLQFKAAGMQSCAQMFSSCGCLTATQMVFLSRCSVVYFPPSPLLCFLCKHQIALLLPSSWRKPNSRWWWRKLCFQPLRDGLWCKGIAEHCNRLKKGLGTAISCHGLTYSWPAVSGISSIEPVFCKNISFLYFLSLAPCSHVPPLVFYNCSTSCESSQHFGLPPDNMWG